MRTCFPSGPGFTIHGMGPWPMRKVTACHLAQASPMPSRIENFISSVWDESLRLARERNQILFSADLIGLQNFVASPTHLRLTTKTTSYRRYVATNKHRERLSAEFGEREASAMLANPLAVCICLRSVDGALLVARRSTQTFDHPGFYHVPGGHIEMEKHLLGNIVNIRRAILDELLEEFALPEQAIRQLICTGLVTDDNTCKPELTFSAQLRIGHHDLSLPSNEEHRSAFWLPDEPRPLAAFLRKHNRCCVPVGKACLLLHGRLSFGLNWFRKVCGVMRTTWP